MRKARILADKDIRKLLGTVILDADEERINPNGIEIRLGKHVLFQATDEDKELGPGMFLKVLPGESVTIASFERFDFREDAVHKVFPGCNVMALITPTTTMMREGIMQSATKVDPGWHGILNWGLRNSSRSTAVEMIDEGIQTRRGMNIDFGYGPVEKVLQRSTRFILGIEIEKSDGNLVGLKPISQGDHDAGFADATFAAHGKDDAL